MPGLGAGLLSSADGPEIAVDPGRLGFTDPPDPGRGGRAGLIGPPSRLTWGDRIAAALGRLGFWGFWGFGGGICCITSSSEWTCWSGPGFVCSAAVSSSADVGSLGAELLWSVDNTAAHANKSGGTGRTGHTQAMVAHIILTPQRVVCVAPRSLQEELERLSYWHLLHFLHDAGAVAHVRAVDGLNAILFRHSNSLPSGTQWHPHLRDN